jgi:hypothetical protein
MLKELIFQAQCFVKQREKKKEKENFGLSTKNLHSPTTVADIHNINLPLNQEYGCRDPLR